VKWHSASKKWKSGSRDSWCGFDLPGLSALEERLSAEAGGSGLWDDPNRARSVMRQLDAVKADLSLWQGLQSRVRDALDLAAVIEDDDEDLAAELVTEADVLARELDIAEATLMFSGPYDAENAVLSIHAGAGGTESQDWAAMLYRMFTRWAERRGFDVQEVSLMPGEEAGIKSATIEVVGRRAYGWLRSERGVHRLVRISPFDSAARRHTSFALVEVSPIVDDDVDVVIDDKDLKVDVFRASGAGGQHVNKSSTAVRLTHLPTGLVVSCQNQRSQSQNRITALKILRGRLLELELERKEAAQARLKGEHVEAGWGNQIRSYVLQPYQMVKDHRTGFETSRTDAVLDGELDPLMDRWLRHAIDGQVQT
jgi:peptide chain release factor 2